MSVLLLIFHIIEITHTFLIHYGYENELREQLRKVHILVRDDFDPLDPENARDPEFINAPTHRKAEHTRWAFLQRLGPALCRFKTVLQSMTVLPLIHTCFPMTAIPPQA
ncbi:hypothetical protein RO3G_06185 [Rhizopus delemar RA 99-880]|uniref:Uncharacterized protein n=1 Tax=Rhizopus delemar (strain RA 99-880 / ATCC MYA-4621 / FGSC 9543 / NRRL 43880) TaxID=246409 RepID=I1BZ50_RHIO9|nr:hypothetical protein RO3G_06185 [Rhizopus delemar RA 99-880]|eukprot:EIE81480.1 hypothetical protein RO3G_06185 [Rhizopus delemar RA 99-880]